MVDFDAWFLKKQKEKEKKNGHKDVRDIRKFNQALIVGFGDNDHAIRELMRFIKMTSRESIFDDATRNEDAPNYKC